MAMPSTNTTATVTSTVTGVVESVNQTGTGVRIGQEWLNFSRNHPNVTHPGRGQRVNVQVERTDRGAWIQSLEVLDGGAIQFPQRRGGGRPQSDPREIRRLACLKAAATFASGRCIAGQDVSSADVLKVAEAFERWVLRGGDQSA